MFFLHCGPPKGAVPSVRILEIKVSHTPACVPITLGVVTMEMPCSGSGMGPKSLHFSQALRTTL